MKNKKIMFSMVVPVFNSENILPDLYLRLNKVMTSLDKDFEIILVDDCSSDNSWDVIQRIHEKDKKVKMIQLTKNFGQHNALMCGFHYAKGRFIVTMDDDLQHPPEEIPKLIKKVCEGFKVVYGQYKEKKHEWFRNFGSRLVNKLLTRITGNKVNVTSFRIIDKSVVDVIINFNGYNVFVDALIFNVISDKEIGYCVVEHHPRKIGKTSYSPKRLLIFALDMIFNFTILPLRLATFIGILFSIISLSTGFYFLIQYLINKTTISGFTSLILSITFLVGILLFVLGIVGEYVGRIFLNINNKPQFVVNKIKL